MSAPVFELLRVQDLPAPMEVVFPFFADARNLEAITPRWLRFRILTPYPIEMRAGTRIDYALRLAGVPVRWRTRIRVWEPGVCFADVQESGPFALWDHEHHFEPRGAGVRMTDRVRYRLPLGALGRAVAARPVRAALERIFDYRAHAIDANLSQAPAMPRSGGRSGIRSDARSSAARA